MRQIGHGVLRAYIARYQLRKYVMKVLVDSNSGKSIRV